MSDPKNPTTENPKKLTVPDDETEVKPKPAGTVETPTAAPATSGRRAPGTKEPILFLWKLVGESSGVVLTLFKSTEREEVEAQLERVRREGYYGNLRILDIDDKVKQPPPVEKVEPPTATKPADTGRKVAKAKAASKTPKKERKATPKPKKTARTPKASGGPKLRATAKASKTKSATKGIKTKRSGSSSGKKRASKKK